MEDILGNTVKVGDIVAHGQRSGNSGCISVKLITDARKVKSRWSDSTIEQVKVQGYTYVTKEYDDELKAWQTCIPYYRLDRGGWTDASVLLVINDSVPKEVKEFLQSQVKA